MAPDLNITWLDLDNRLGTAVQEPAKGKQPEHKSEQPIKSAVSKGASSPKSQPRPVVAGTRRKAKIHKRDELANAAPGDAALVLLLRLAKIRQSPYASAVSQLIGVFYDSRLLLARSGLSVLDDFETMLIATPNPYRVRRTFVAIRHRRDEAEIRSALERGVGPAGLDWQTRGAGMATSLPSPPALPGDRRVLLLRPGLALLAEAAQLPSTATDRTSKQPSLLTRLTKLSGETDDRKPALEVQAHNLARLVQAPAGFPLPLGLHLTVSAKNPAHADLQLRFAAPGSARRFVTALSPQLERARASLWLRVLGLGPLLEQLQPRRRGTRVYLAARLSAEQLTGLLDAFRAAIPQVRMPTAQQRPPL